ncbi:FAD-binding oxidoreductase [Mumia zhuanghuii]|uniref:FAD-binding oxidoreductase n=2 Tax=Mumia TaxID=1546255 RepID=A0ABW1QJK0_9ACTN|nr:MULTISPECIES: FAD-binding oxidoreductase [Mumia]KAA1418268.1 FAD-binding oxidoreductase [Mumia zhuanghuii]
MNPTTPDTLVEHLRGALGPTAVLTGPEDTDGYTADWRGAYRGAALAVVRPGSTDEVATVVRLCRKAGVSIVPQGGNTGMCGGGVPDASATQVVLSTTRMRRVREVDPANDAITVDAGVTLDAVHEAARAHGRMFPLTLGSQGSCTIGGNVATNAGGAGVLRYGMMRDLVLGLEVVLPDGQVWDGLRGLRKDNTGYDLKQLFVGAEGTLGIVTAAVLRLFPETPARATVWVALPDLGAGVALLELLKKHAGPRLGAYELVSRTALDLVLEHTVGAHDPFGQSHPWYGLIELEDADDAARLEEVVEAGVGAAFEQELVTDAVVAGSPAQRAALWGLREGISEAQNAVGASLKQDVSVPISSLAAFTADVDAAVEAVLPGVRRVTYGHVGDGNLHYNLSKPDGADDAGLLDASDALTKAVYDVVAAYDGSLSAEHGLGRTKTAAAAAYKDPVELALMRTVKAALDPAGTMNPGVLLA